MKLVTVEHGSRCYWRRSGTVEVQLVTDDGRSDKRLWLGIKSTHDTTRDDEREDGEMKDEAEAGLLYEAQSKLMRSREGYCSGTHVLRWVQGPLLWGDMDAAGTKPLGSARVGGRRRRRS